MKLQVSNSNEPNWRCITVSAEIPKELKPLEEMSKNLWWVWNQEGKRLFHDLDRDLWRRVGENPVMLLQQMSYERCQGDHRRRNVHGTHKKRPTRSFQDYMKQPMDDKIPSVAYFSMEYGLCNSSENLLQVDSVCLPATTSSRHPTAVSI